jgi:hypothetical protein
MNPRQVLVVFAAALILLVDTATAQSETTRLEGRLPDTAPPVSIDQTRGTVLDALDALATQAGFSLVVTAPESLTARPLAIHVVKQPAGEALRLILEAGDLRATFANGVLKVQSDVPGPGESGRARRHERGGRRGPERVVMGRSLRVGPDDVVDKAVAIGGSVTILGHVRRDAVAVGGSVTLLPGARVDGDAVAIGGTVTVEPGATLGGDNVSLGGTLPVIVGSLGHWFGGREPFVYAMFGFASRLARAVLLLALALLIAAVFPAPVSRVGAFLVSRPGLSSLAALALLFGFAPLCALLAMTIIGIPLIPVAGLLLVALLLFGFTVSAGWLGERIPLLQEGKTPLKAVALGGAALVIVGLVPWIGTLALAIAALISAGAALLSRFGRRSIAVAA